MSKINEFIISLERLTSLKEMNWMKLDEYLDHQFNNVLDDFLIKSWQYEYSKVHSKGLKRRESYITEINESFVYLFKIKNNYKIYVQNNINAEIREVPIKNKENQNRVNELSKKITEDINSINKTIDKVISIANLKSNED